MPSPSKFPGKVWQRAEEFGCGHIISLDFQQFDLASDLPAFSVWLSHGLWPRTRTYCLVLTADQIGNPVPPTL